MQRNTSQTPDYIYMAVVGPSPCHFQSAQAQAQLTHSSGMYVLLTTVAVDIFKRSYRHLVALHRCPLEVAKRSLAILLLLVGKMGWLKSSPTAAAAGLRL